MNALSSRQNIVVVLTLILLAGVSFALFPAHTQAASPAGVAGATGISGTTGAWSSTGACNLSPPPDNIVIKEDGSVNSTTLQRHGNTYTLTGDLINQTLVI